jgi:hypothetical protein
LGASLKDRGYVRTSQNHSAARHANDSFVRAATCIAGQGWGSLAGDVGADNSEIAGGHLKNIRAIATALAAGSVRLGTKSAEEDHKCDELRCLFGVRELVEHSHLLSGDI